MTFWLPREGAVQRLGHGPGADIVLQVNRQAGAGFQCRTERHLQRVVKRHAMHHARLHVDHTRQRDGDRRQPLQLALVADKELVDFGQDAFQQRFRVFGRQRQLLLNHQFAAEIAQRQRDAAAADAGGQVVPGLGVQHQPHRRAAPAADFLVLGFLDQMGFQQFAHDLGDAGGRQLRAF